MSIKHFLALKFPKYFENNRIKYLKSLGVDFHEDNADNFIPIKNKNEKKIVRDIKAEQLVKRLNNEDFL